MSFELVKAFIARRGRGVSGQAVEVQSIGRPEYPKKGAKIAEDFTYDHLEKKDPKEMTKFISGLGYDPCVVMGVGLDNLLHSAKARNEHTIKTKGNKLIELGLCTAENALATVNAVTLSANTTGSSFEEMVELMVLAKTNREKKEAEKKENEKKDKE